MNLAAMLNHLWQSTVCVGVGALVVQLVSTKAPVEVLVIASASKMPRGN